jgi:Holliday junction resolvase RusA-like endonuclease
VTNPVAHGPLIDPDDVIVRVVAEGEPRPWPRSRINRAGKLYLPRDYVEARAVVSNALRSAYRDAVGAFRPPYAGQVGLLVGLYRRTFRRVDIDNLTKTVLDAGVGVVWVDDSQVVSLVARILPDPDNPRTEIVVWAMPANRSIVRPADADDLDDDGG